MIQERVGVPVEKGPKDLREIPRYFGQAAVRAEYGAYTVEILAEINNAPRLSRDAVRAAADYYRASGADLIDIGCTPGLAYPDLSVVVRELREAGMRVSVDSFDPDEIRTAVEAGAELVLSVNRSNLAVARELAGTSARVVVIPDLGEGLDSLEPQHLGARGLGGRLFDRPIIEPIGFGFMASLERYAEMRRRYPHASQLMGIGNITELTSADTTGVNAVLIAICEELGVERGAHHRGDPVGPRRGAGDRRRPAPHAPRREPPDHPQGRGRPAGHGEGPGDPGVRRGGAARGSTRR